MGRACATGRCFAGLLVVVALVLGVVHDEPARASALQLRTLATGLAQAAFVTAPPDDPTRLFIVHQSGRISILDLATETVLATPFIDLSSRIAYGFGEQGLLGLAFHPEYESNGLFYVSYTTIGSGTSVVLRLQVSANPDIALPGSGRVVVRALQPQGNHNGGWIGFGPDGYLYVAIGDGGAGNDQGVGHDEPGGNAQTLDRNLLGKILRIDVDGDDFPNDPQRNYSIPADNPFVGIEGDDPIWVYGLRNPWRASFDRATGDLWIGDVGQLAEEEIDMQPAASVGGENYGWRLREGTRETPTGSPPVGGPRPAGSVDPVHAYARPSSGSAVIGGYVYRGPITWLQGTYFFSDSRIGKVWSFRFDGSDPVDFDGDNHGGVTTWTDDPGFLPADGSTIFGPSSFGEDAAGNLYLVDHGGFFGADGKVFLVPEPAPGLLAAVALVVLACIRRRASRSAMREGARRRVSQSPRAWRDPGPILPCPPAGGLSPDSWPGQPSVGLPDPSAEHRGPPPHTWASSRPGRVAGLAWYRLVRPDPGVRTGSSATGASNARAAA